MVITGSRSPFIVMVEFEYEIQLKEVFRVLEIAKVGKDVTTGEVTVCNPLSAHGG